MRSARPPTARRPRAMTPAPGLAWPPGRALAGWARQRAPLRPRAFWVGHLLLHRLEALVGLDRSTRLDPFALAVLRALALTPLATVPRLADRLHLDRAVLGRVLQTLQTK